MATIEVRLSEELKAHVDAVVAAGEYPDSSTYVGALIEDEREKLVWLRAAIAKGDASGISPRTGAEIVERALERARRKWA